MIHRDVKPTNVFRVKTGIVKVLDLGFGELVGMAGQAGNVFDTDEGIVVGTTDFMSPEQVKQRRVDARSDLFSLGCTMYRLLTGTYAFPGVTREDRLIKRIRERHVPIADVRPGLPYRLEAIVDRLLAISPADRFGSAAEVAEALEALIPPSGRTERETSARPVTKGPRPGAAAPPEEPEELDWSLIESALREPARGARQSARLVDRPEPKLPFTRSLSSHRQDLDEGCIESGREVHEKYRNELIQMNRATTETRSSEPKDEESTSEEVTWLELIGESFGDFLAEPSAGPFLLAILGIFVVLMLALGVALG